MVTRELEDQVRGELERGETLTWQGMPVPRFFTPGATVIFLFAIPWTAFSLFWTAGAALATTQGNATGLSSFVFPLFGVPFILVGVGMLSAPLRAYRTAGRTVYAITNRRAITIQGGRTRTIRSYTPEQLESIYRKERADGTGDVILSVRHSKDSDGGRQTEELGFLCIREPREVEQLLKSLAEKKHPRD